MQQIDQPNYTKVNSYLLFVIAITILGSCSDKKNHSKQASRSNTIPVKVAPIDSASSITQITTSGLISTESEARLSFKIGGVIDRVMVEEGEKVYEGQLLASLNSTEIAAQVQQVQLAVDKAQRDYQRLVNLYKDSVVTLEQFQNSKTGLEMARQNLEQVLFNRQYANIYAPSNGFIIKKLLNAGEVAAPGTPVLVVSELGRGSNWVLRAGVADREWAIIEKGNKAHVTTDAFPGKSFVATVTKKALAADLASGSFQIEMELDVKGQHPAVGMFGKATITPSSVTKGYSIPYESLLEADGNKGYVFVTDDRKTVQKIQVTIASIENDRVLIADGLGSHAFVVTSGSPYLTSGAGIRITQ